MARTRAGEQIAAILQGTTSAPSQPINQQGMDLSNIIGSGGNNIANLLAGYGTAGCPDQAGSGSAAGEHSNRVRLCRWLAFLAAGANDPGISGVGDSQRYRQPQHRQRMPVYPAWVSAAGWDGRSIIRLGAD